MNRFPRFLLLLSLAFLLAACAIKERVVYKNVLIAPKDSFLVDCQIDEPPNYKRYFILTWPEKEDQLIQFGSRQTLNLITCNKRFSELRAWKQDQLKIYQP